MYITFVFQLLHLITLSLIFVMVVNPDTLKQSGNDPRGAGSGVEQLTVEPVDVQAVNCGAEMPCILAAQGDGNTEQVTSDFSLSISNFMTTHRPNTGTVYLPILAFVYSSIKKKGCCYDVDNVNVQVAGRKKVKLLKSVMSSFFPARQRG